MIGCFSSCSLTLEETPVVQGEDEDPGGARKRAESPQPTFRLSLGLCSCQQMSLPIAGRAIAATARALVDRLGGRVAVGTLSLAAPGCAARAALVESAAA